MGDLKRPEKRQAYLDVGGQCWYVLGLDGNGRPIGKESEIRDEGGVMVKTETRLEVVQMAPKVPSQFTFRRSCVTITPNKRAFGPYRGSDE